MAGDNNDALHDSSLRAPVAGQRGGKEDVGPAYGAMLVDNADVVVGSLPAAAVFLH